MGNDDELERYLSEFRPRAVRPLEPPRRAARAWISQLAFAATVLVCAGAGLWYARHGNSTPAAAVRPVGEAIENQAATVRPNPFSLTKLALENNRQFEAQLDAESRRVLPSFQDEQSLLRVFAKE
jgi:glutathione S-transferase